MCWYCNKELDGNTISYKRKHRRQSKRIDLIVHSDCYKSIRSNKPRYLRKGYGSITQ